ncbi:MAG: hypothetical protein WEC83_01145 [Patescibacteria group bacterium]
MVERGVNLPESQASLEVSPSELPAIPVEVRPEASPETPASVVGEQPSDQPASPEPSPTPTVEQLALPSIEAIASGGVTADAETTQTAMTQVFESNTDHAA